MASPQPSPAAPPRPRYDFGLLWRALGYLRPQAGVTAAAYAATIGVIGLNLALPQFIRWIIDAGILGRQPAVVGWAVLGLLVLTLVKGVLMYGQGRWSEVASQHVAYALRNAIQRKLTNLSFAFHNQAEAGELLSRAMQDVERIRFLTGRATLRLLESAMLFGGTGVLLVWMNPLLAVAALAILPFLAYVALTFGQRFRPLSLETQRQLATLTTRVEQNLRGGRVVRAFAQEAGEIERFKRENDRWFRLSWESVRLEAVNLPLLILIANLGTVAILWLGGQQVIDGALTVGELVAFTTYLAQFVNPMRLLGMVIPAIAIASSAAERIFEILDTTSTVADAPDAQPLGHVTGHLRFEAVSFSYAQRPVLKDIDFEARPGQVIALFGPTGSGKSSIVNLIPRFYDPTSGRITLDGHDLRTVTLNSLRSQIGTVLQETTLFVGSVRENIAFGRPGATEDEIVAAAQGAQAHEFITRMSQGYDTRVGERGVTLSGGQRQRLAIARTLLLDPRILILDDATASVDSETERLIGLALERVMQGRTTFIIAHRLSTIRRADEILVLDHGRIRARGDHAALVQSSRFYAQLVQKQLRSEAA
jgi:ATP-binding cassette subfamily B protein